MRAAFTSAIVACSVAATVLLQPGASVAQEGHPLRGSWIGTWEGNPTHDEFVLLVLEWDGKKISGVINPGTDDMEVTSATLDPDGWVVRIEAQASIARRRTVHYVVEGKIEHIELATRSIVGTWRSELGNGDFKVVRQ